MRFFYLTFFSEFAFSQFFTALSYPFTVSVLASTASSEFGTYRICEQRRFRRACASAQSRQNLRCSLIQAVSQEEPSDRKPDPWPLWMAGHAQLKFVMTECSKTQIRLTGLDDEWNEPSHEIMILFVLSKLILQTRMHSHPVGLDVWFLVGPLVYLKLYVCKHRRLWWDCASTQAIRAGSPDPSLVMYMISTIISWAGSNSLWEP